MGLSICLQFRLSLQKPFKHICLKQTSQFLLCFRIKFLILYGILGNTIIRPVSGYRRYVIAMLMRADRRPIKEPDAHTRLLLSCLIKHVLGALKKGISFLLEH